MRMYLSVIGFVLFLSSVFTIQAQSVLTQHNDIKRTGWYDKETHLNTGNVRAGSFGKLFARSVDNQVYAQPLVMLHVNIPDIGAKNILYVAMVIVAAKISPASRRRTG